MPFITVYTNVETKDPNKLAEDTSNLVSEVLHKPISYVVANIVYNPAMAFGGKSEEKGALVNVLSIGIGNKDKLVADLTNLLSLKLGITKLQNISISLVDAPASLVAGSGHTFG